MEIDIKPIGETYREDRMYIVCMANPPRVGALLFSTILENWKYPPDTPENSKYEIGVVRFGDLGSMDKKVEWFVISLPIDDKPYAMEAAKKSFVVLRNTIPIVINEMIIASLSIPKINDILYSKVDIQPFINKMMGPNCFQQRSIQVFPLVKPNVYTIENDIKNLTNEKYKYLLSVERQLCEKIGGKFEPTPETEKQFEKFRDLIEKI